MVYDQHKEEEHVGVPLQTQCELFLYFPDIVYNPNWLTRNELLCKRLAVNFHLESTAHSAWFSQAAL